MHAGTFRNWIFACWRNIQNFTGCRSTDLCNSKDRATINCTHSFENSLLTHTHTEKKKVHFFLNVNGRGIKDTKKIMLHHQRAETSSGAKGTTTGRYITLCLIFFPNTFLYFQDSTLFTKPLSLTSHLLRGCETDWFRQPQHIHDISTAPASHQKLSCCTARFIKLKISVCSLDNDETHNAFFRLLNIPVCLKRDEVDGYWIAFDYWWLFTKVKASLDCSPLNFCNLTAKEDLSVIPYHIWRKVKIHSYSTELTTFFQKQNSIS